jgi:hypothetical protein
MRKIYADAGPIVLLGTATNSAVLSWHGRYEKVQNALSEDNKFRPAALIKSGRRQMQTLQAFMPVTGVVKSASEI